MKEFTKVTKILWMRNRIWIIMILTLFLLIQGMTANSSVVYQEREIIRQVAELEWVYDNQGTGKSLNEYKNYTIDEYKIEQVKKKYKDGYPKDFFAKYDAMFDELAEDYNFNSELSYEVWLNLEDEKVLVIDYEDINFYTKEVLYFYNQNVNSRLVRESGESRLDIADKIFNDGGIFFVILLLVFLFTNSENLTMYYDFTRIFPWSKTTTYISKVVFGLVLILLTYIASIGIKYLVWGGSNMKDIMIVNDFWAYGIPTISFVIGLYLMTMAVGFLAGNVLGYFGLLIIAFFGLDLIMMNIEGVSQLILGSLSDDFWTRRFAEFIRGLPKVAQIILTPINVFNYGQISDKMSAYYGIFILGVIFFFIGCYWENTKKSERSGMLIMKKSVSNYAQVLGVFTTANLIYFMVSSMSDLRAVSTGIFVVTFLLARLFYKKLFNVRIGI